MSGAAVRLQHDWRLWRRGAAIHPGWTWVVFFTLAGLSRGLRAGLVLGLLFSLPVVTSCISVAKVNNSSA